MKCKKCGSEVSEELKFCSECGANMRKMFEKIWDFGYERTGKQAFGFFLFHMILMSNIYMCIAWGIIGLLCYLETIDICIAFILAVLMPFIYLYMISIIILVKKQLYKNVGAILLTIFSCFILCPVFLTMFESERK